MTTRRTDFSTILLFLLSAVFVLLFVCAGYWTLTHLLVRMSADFYFPFLKATEAVENSGVKHSLLLRDKTELAKALTIMQKENLELAARAALVHKLQDENEQLRRLMRIQSKGKLKIVFAESILRDPITWSTVFTIDKGEAEGIRAGDAVLASTPVPGQPTGVVALAGRIRSVTRHTAVVSTVYSEDCVLSVLLPESKSYGVLQGDNRQRVESVPLNYLPVNAKYAAGEVVMSSGFSERTPPGLFIGTLTPFPEAGAAARISEEHLYAHALMKPAVNVNLIRFVAVITGSAKP